MPNFYEILDVPQNASQNAIKQAYRNLALQYHPDKTINKSEEIKYEYAEKMKQLNVAYATLRDVAKRNNYDYMLKYCAFSRASSSSASSYGNFNDAEQEFNNLKRNQGGSQSPSYDPYAYTIPAELSWSIFLETFIEVYAPDSYDLINRTFNHETIAELLKKEPYKGNPALLGKHIDDYRRNPWILLTTFLGLPNFCELGVEFTLIKFLKNFAGIEDNKSFWRNVINWGLSPFVILKNGIFAPLKLAVNIFKILTEYLTALMIQVCGYAAFHTYQYALGKIADKANAEKAKGYALLIFVSFPMFILAYVALNLQYFGRATTSPIDNIRRSWKIGLQEDKIAYGSDKPFWPQVAGYAFACLLVVYSALFTAMMWGLIWAYAVTVIPALAAQIATFATQTAMPALAALFTYFMEAPAALGYWTGLLGVCILGTCLDRVADYIRQWWETTCYDDEPKPGGDSPQLGPSTSPRHQPKVRDGNASRRVVPFKAQNSQQPRLHGQSGNVGQNQQGLPSEEQKQENLINATK